MHLDVAEGQLVLRSSIDCDNDVDIRYVTRPSYYSTQLPSGRDVTRLVSACGLSEMNIWPWHDCAIGRLCRFCGINSVHHSAGAHDAITASNGATIPEAWLADLRSGVIAASADPTYRDELFPMIISGHLQTKMLDQQAITYAALARVVAPLVQQSMGREGLVAMTAPPHDMAMLQLQRDAGIRTMAINLEAYSEEVFRVQCPGKHRIGRDHYLTALFASRDVFGPGFSWTNFVLGLEPIESLLAGCKALAREGITPGASVLHFDKGAALRGATPPAYDEVLWFYRELAQIYRENDQRPFFSSRALRSSLANEAYDGRLW